MAYEKDEIESIFETVLKRIENGEALRTILKEDSMPSTSTFYIWMEEDESKSKRYAYATDIRADGMFEDILDIADESYNDTSVNEEGQERTNHEVIARSRLRVDARKWYLSKLKPKKYGDKIENTIQGGDKPITTIVSLGTGVKPD